MINDQTYVVRALQPEGIYIATGMYSDQFSLLINNNSRWQVYSYNVPHTVNFKADVPDTNLAGATELNYQILLNLPYEDLQNACLTNRALAEICADDYFWQSKILNDYDQEVLEEKPEKSTHQQYYIQLMQITPDAATEQALLSIFKYIDGRPSQKSINKAAYFGHVNVINNLIHKYDYDLSQIARLALYGGQVEVLQLLADMNVNLQQAIYQQDLGHAALLNRLDGWRKSKHFKWMKMWQRMLHR